MKYTDLVIIGSGPAAYTAAIYTARANIKTVLYEGFYSGIPGGQLMTTTMVENFPGFPEGIMGSDLMANMKNQAKRFDVDIISEDVKNVDLSKHPLIVNGSKTSFEASSIRVATGATAKRADIKGASDNEFWQKGVSACAICDGAAPIFKNKNVYVIGGGDSALEEAIFLTRFASKVFIVHRRDKLRASDIMIKKASNNPKVEMLLNSEITSVLGDKIVNSVVIKDNISGDENRHDAAGVFFAIGHTPNVSFLNGQITLNKRGYIDVKDCTTYTNIEGVFAAGDVQDYKYKQAITAAGSGCMAALDVERWLTEKGILRK